MWGHLIFHNNCVTMRAGATDLLNSDWHPRYPSPCAWHQDTGNKMSLISSSFGSNEGDRCLNKE